MSDPEKRNLLYEMDVLCHVIEALKSTAKSAYDDNLRSKCYITVDNISKDLISKYNELKKSNNKTEEGNTCP